MEHKILQEMRMCRIVTVAVNNLVLKVVLVKAQLGLYICKLCKELVIFCTSCDLQICVFS